MNIRCTSCQTVFRVDPAKVPAGGVRARCAVCGSAMAVAPDSAPAPSPHTPAAALALAPVAAEPAPSPVPPVQAAPPVAAAPVVEAAPEPAPAAPAPRAPRLSQPFFQPRVSRPAEKAPPAPPRRPSAPVFRPTPGQPVTAAPPPRPPPTVEAVPHEEHTAVVPAQRAFPVASAPPAAQPVVEAPTPAPAALEPVAAEAPKKPINPFLQRDPKQKARRLARALISDMIVYQPDKRQQALAAGTLKDEFEEEIQKSWEEYVEQVGEDMATTTAFWTEALNDILAGGQQLF